MLMKYLTLCHRRNVVNTALSDLEKATEVVRKPLLSSWASVQTNSATLLVNAKYTYAKRKENAPYVIAGSALFFGSIMTLRRGRIAGALSAGIAGAGAYGIVYDQISFDKIPDLVFGQKDN